jgi:hypothetical protein
MRKGLRFNGRDYLLRTSEFGKEVGRSYAWVYYRTRDGKLKEDEDYVMFKGERLFCYEAVSRAKRISEEFDKIKRKKLSKSAKKRYEAYGGLSKTEGRVVEYLKPKLKNIAESSLGGEIYQLRHAILRLTKNVEDLTAVIEAARESLLDDCVKKENEKVVQDELGL